MRTDQYLLYFSLNPDNVSAFKEYMDISLYDKRIHFHLCNTEPKEFRHASDLLFFLDGQKDWKNLYVIIDYTSFYNNHLVIPSMGSENPIGNGKDFSAKEASNIVRNAILKYPEVFFLFDESWLSADDIDGAVDFRDFLFFDGGVDKNVVFKDYYSYRVNSNDPFLFIKRDRSNLYDSGNLRYAIKRYLYDSLKMERYNFSIIQDSRKDHLALVVEEEMAQNRFNSYCLYANGFRVLPITSSEELKYCNENADKLNPVLVIRDFDLQFDDVGEDRLPQNVTVLQGEKELDHLQIYKVDEIRRAKRNSKNYWYILEYGEEKTGQKDIHLKVKNKDYKNDYWSTLRKIKTYFVTKGPKNIDVTSGEQPFFLTDGKGGRQIITGLEKPVAGIYLAFNLLKDVSCCSEKALSMGDVAETSSSHAQQYSISTDRENHEHGVPLDIYDIVKAMITRAKMYQRRAKYSLSAIVAREAIEIMNGFHEQLLLQAYYIVATSENAIAMNVLGGDDEMLRNDTLYRIEKITHDVKRLIHREDGRERAGLKLNLLNQIFSDCRQYCKGKEHFLSEDAFVSAMGHLNDGLLSRTDSQQKTKLWSRFRKTIKIHFGRDACFNAEKEWFKTKILEAFKDKNDEEIIKLCKKITGQSLISIQSPFRISNVPIGCTWESSDTSIVSVDNNGCLTPVENGFAVVFCSCKDKVVAYPVVVKINQKDNL